MKKIVALLLTAALMASLMAACGNNDDQDSQGSQGNGSQQEQDKGNGEAQQQDPSDEGPVETSEDTLTIALFEEPSTLLLAPTYTKALTLVTCCMTETLFEWNEKTGEVLPRLGDFEWLDDTHFRVTLKEGIKFGNGEELTTEDVLYTFQTKSSISPGAYSTINLEATQIEDDYNMVFETNEVIVQAPERWVQDQFAIYSKKSLEAMGGAETTEIYPSAGNEGIGTGKYVFKEWVSGQYILLERNENYWNQEDMPYYKNLKFVFINDSAARAMAVESGDVDVASEIPCGQATIYENDENVNAYYVDSMLTGVLFMNCSNGPLQDEKVREAIWNLVDVNALNQLAAAGFGKICETTISPYSITYDQPADSNRQVNVERAKELLADAGYPDGFSIELNIMSMQKESAEIIKENLRQGGIDAEIIIKEIPAHFDLLRSGEYGLILSDLSPVYYTENLRLVDGRISTSVVSGGANYKDEEFYP